MDIAIAADGRVGAPFIARNAHEFSGDIEFPRQRIEFAPEFAGDLEIIALMADDVEKRLVTAELKYSRVVLVPSVSFDWPWVSPQKCTYAASLSCETHRI